MCSRLNEKHRLEFLAEYFFYSYFVKRENPKKIGRYVLNSRSKAKLLMLGFSSNERRWKDKYFFVRGHTLLGKGLGYPSY